MSPRLIAFLVIGISVLLPVGFLIWQSMQPEEDEEEGSAFDGAKTQSELEKTLALSGAGRKSRMIAMVQSLEDSLESRGAAKGFSAKDRLTLPWFMLVGAEGSGKRTILGNTGIPLPYGPPVEVDAVRKDAGRWWLFEQAVVLEAPTAAPTAEQARTLKPDETLTESSPGWLTLLHMLRRERPDSPLNGIIVTISCADLAASRRGTDDIEQKAGRVKNFLDRTREMLGVRLPIHFVVTKCDSLTGFRAFAETLPEQRRHDIFGWSNAHSLEKPFEPGWVDEGFASLKRSLTDLQDELLAAPDELHDTDGLFVFVSEFMEMQESLREFISRVMPQDERRPSLFLRGMYFTGDTIDHSHALAASAATVADLTAKGTMRISSEVGAAPGEDVHNLVFLKSLFQEKIFREAGLARPLARFRLARDRRVVAAQAAALLIALGGGIGLWTSVNGFTRDNQVYRTGLRAQAEALTRVLSGVAIDLDEVKRDERPTGPDSLIERRSRDAAVIELVGQMRDVPPIKVRSPFIPTSWFSPLPEEIRSSMMAGVQDIVLPVCRQRLQERAERLLGVSGQVGLVVDEDILDRTDPRSLTTYLSEVRALSRNVARYNTLATPGTGDVKDLGALLDYLFGERPFGSDSSFINPDFQRALKDARAPRLTISEDRAQAVVRRAVGMVAAVADAAANQLAPRPTPATLKAVKPEDDLAALRALAALVELTDSKTGLVMAVSDSAVLGIRLARVVEDSIAARLKVVAAKAVKDTVPVEQSTLRLRAAVHDAFAQRFMEPPENHEISEELVANQHLRWDVGQLESAMSLRGDFQRTVTSLSDAFPGQQQADRFRRALEIQLRSKMIDVAGGAQRYLPAVRGADALTEMRAEAANLDAATPRLFRLASQLDSLHATAEGRKLVELGARQAEHVLATAQGVFDRNRYLAPQPKRVADWRGPMPIGFAAFGVSDTNSFAGTLVAQFNAVIGLSRDVAPAVKYLRIPALKDSTHLPRLLADWELMSANAAKYDTAGTLTDLKRYVGERNAPMLVADPVSCQSAANQPDTMKASTDVFLLRRRMFRAALMGRCGPPALEAVVSYEKLRGLFMSKLAGKFPFVVDAATAAVAPDADPAAVRDFLRQYDAFTAYDDVALRSDPRLIVIGKGAVSFLDQVALVRPFFAPILDRPGDRGALAMTLLLGAGESGAVPERAIEVGDRWLTIEETEHELPWQSGERIRIVMASSDTTKAPALSAAGSWAALRLAMFQPKPTLATVRFFHPDTKIELALPAFPTFAPEIVIPRGR